MKTFIKIIAWIGVGFMTIGTVISFFTWMAIISYTPGPNPTFGPEAYWLYIIPIDLLALLLMFIGGLIVRPRYYWSVSISLGLLHILVSLPQEWSFLVQSIRELGIKGFGRLVFFIWPGLAAILLGIFILILDKFLEKKKRNEA